MLNKLKKISDEIDSMNPISRKIMKYGVELFIVLICISTLAPIANKYLYNSIYSVTENSIYMFKTSFSILAIAVIGSIIMDFIHRKG